MKKEKGFKEKFFDAFGFLILLTAYFFTLGVSAFLSMVAFEAVHTSAFSCLMFMVVGLWTVAYFLILFAVLVLRGKGGL